MGRFSQSVVPKHLLVEHPPRSHRYHNMYRCSKVEKDPIESVRNLRKKRTRVKAANPVHVDEGMNARAFVFGVRGCSVASASTVYIHWY